MKTITKKTTGWLVMAAARTRQALTLVAAAAVMGLVTASCSNEDNLAEEPNQQPEENTDAVKTYTMTVVATKGDDAMTRALTYDSGTKALNATWTKDDVVEVYALNWERFEQSGNKDVLYNVYLGMLTAQGDGESTTLDGTIIAPPAVPAEYQSMASVTPLGLVFPRFPKIYTGQKGTLADIAANFDYADCYIIDWTETDGKISTADDVEFSNGSQAIVRFTLQDKAGNPINAKSLTLHDASDDDFILSTDEVSATFGDQTISLDDASSEVWVSIYGSISTSSILEMTATTEDGETYTYSKTGVSIDRGSFYSITVKMERETNRNLSAATTDITLRDGDVLTGTLNGEEQPYKISIAAGATVTLDGATINGWSDNAKYASQSSVTWAGLTCLGDATIVLADGSTNTVKGFYKDYPGIHVAPGHTLTIQGTGALTASNNGRGAGIGGGNHLDCGNIVITGGNITASGSLSSAGIGGGDATCGTITISGGTIEATANNYGAGIGSGFDGTCGAITISGGTVNATNYKHGAGIGSGSYGSCGTITISGGTVNATGGQLAAGIGSGYSESSCGDIIITTGVTSVTATKGENATTSGVPSHLVTPCSIGNGYDSTCGKVTIGCTLDVDGNPVGGTVYRDGIATSPYTYTPTNP